MNSERRHSSNLDLFSQRRKHVYKREEDRDFSVYDLRPSASGHSNHNQESLSNKSITNMKRIQFYRNK